MAKKHKGNGSGNSGQGAVRRRGPETGNGYTASTGRGKPSDIQVPGVVGKAADLAARILGRKK